MVFKVPSTPKHSMILWLCPYLSWINTAANKFLLLEIGRKNFKPPILPLEKGNNETEIGKLFLTNAVPPLKAHLQLLVGVSLWSLTVVLPDLLFCYNTQMCFSLPTAYRCLLWIFRMLHDLVLLTSTCWCAWCLHTVSSSCCPSMPSHHAAGSPGAPKQVLLALAGLCPSSQPWIPLIPPHCQPHPIVPHLCWPWAAAWGAVLPRLVPLFAQTHKWLDGFPFFPCIPLFLI